jgi:hypothetical protein
MWADEAVAWIKADEDHRLLPWIWEPGDETCIGDPVHCRVFVVCSGLG